MAKEYILTSVDMYKKNGEKEIKSERYLTSSSPKNSFNLKKITYRVNVPKINEKILNKISFGGKMYKNIVKIKWYKGGWKSLREFLMLDKIPINEILADQASSPKINFGTKIKKLMIKIETINKNKELSFLKTKFIFKLYN